MVIYMEINSTQPYISPKKKKPSSISVVAADSSAKHTAEKRQRKPSKITLLQIRDASKELFFASTASTEFYEAVETCYDLIRLQLQQAGGAYSLSHLPAGGY